MPGRSVVTNLLELNEEVNEAFRLETQVDAIYLDLAKAFDKVDHGLLLGKLSKFGVKDKMLEWFETYLLHRTHSVLVNGESSREFLATSGVPQGSKLGPLLFAIFINDMVEVVKHSKITLFADDCRIMKRVKSQKDYEELQHDLTEMCSWMKENLLIINEDKCQKITFSRLPEIFTADYYIGNIRIKEVDYVRDLGVYLDKGWTFDMHIDRILARAHRTLGFIKRITYNYYSIDPIIYLFKTPILPGLNFASTI